MTTYMVIGSVLLILVMILASKALIPKTKQQDSALRQRAIFSMHEQLTYTRLKEILPHHTVLAHVSYDALLTTKFRVHEINTAIWWLILSLWIVHNKFWQWLL